ncbi:MAG: energy transducer TonB family protein [Bryobacteraceae bacterium]
MRHPPTTAETVDGDPADLKLLPEREPVTARRFLRAGAGSAVVHGAILVVMLSLPAIEPTNSGPMITPDFHQAVHLVAPPKLIAPKFFEPTQKDPNKGKISRELDVRSARSAPRPQAPKFRPPAPVPGPVTQARATPPIIEPPKIEPPKVEAPQIAQAQIELPNIAAPVQPPPPANTSANQPKLAFESVGPGTGHVIAPNPNVAIPRPRPSVEHAKRQAIGGAGGTVVGDTGDSATPVPGSEISPSTGHAGSNLQLLSDSHGVDFKPYLIQVLVAVRRNWMAVFPEAARLGMRGRVLIQFSIDRNGGVPKLVIAEGAGSEPLDRAAVAAVSASYPFPPLPADYRGNQIRLQLAFAYNMPKR